MITPRVILFDLDDTLFAHTEAVANGLARHMQLSGCSKAIEDPGAAYTIWRELEERHYSSHLRGEVGFQEQRRLRACDFALSFGLSITNDNEADAWFEQFLVEYRQAWSLYDDVVPALNSLTEEIPGVRFGIITNGEKTISWEKIHALNLSERMENTVISGEFGFTKPDRRIFEYACKLFSTDANEVMYIGDRLETDAIGALEAGLTGVWLDRTGTGASSKSELKMIPVIRSLEELPTLVKLHIDHLGTKKTKSAGAARACTFV
jgi:putative hydrolase of the HAD superfamily